MSGVTKSGWSDLLYPIQRRPTPGRVADECPVAIQRSGTRPGHRNVIPQGPGMPCALTSSPVRPSGIQPEPQDGTSRNASIADCRSVVSVARISSSEASCISATIALVGGAWPAMRVNSASRARTNLVPAAMMILERGIRSARCQWCEGNGPRSVRCPSEPQALPAARLGLIDRPVSGRALRGRCRTQEDPSAPWTPGFIARGPTLGPNHVEGPGVSWRVEKPVRRALTEAPRAS